MRTIADSQPLRALGLPAGEHLVRFHVNAGEMLFEIAASLPAMSAPPPVRSQQPVWFVKKWGGTGSKCEDPEDAWLTHLNEKHLR